MATSAAKSPLHSSKDNEVIGGTAGERKRECTQRGRLPNPSKSYVSCPPFPEIFSELGVCTSHLKAFYSVYFQKSLVTWRLTDMVIWRFTSEIILWSTSVVTSVNGELLWWVRHSE